MSSSNSINEYGTEDRLPDVLHAWCRWRTFINHFLIDRIRFGWKPRGNVHATTYFQILNGIEVPPTLTPEQHLDNCLIASDDPKTLDWLLKHNIPRAKYRYTGNKYLYSSSSVNSLSNSEVSFGSSGLSSGWTSYSSLESDGEVNVTKTQRRRRRRSNHSNDKSLLTWSRLKLKLTQRKRQSASSERLGPSQSQSSQSVSPISSNYSDGSSQHWSSSHDRQGDSNYSVNSRKFPLVSKIFLPDWSTEDQQKFKDTLSKDKRNRLMTDKQGRVFIDVGHVLRHGHPLDVDKSDQHARIILRKDAPAPKVRPRLRMYGSKMEDDIPAEKEYFNFMFDKFKELYHEDADLLTTLSQKNSNKRTGEQLQNCQNPTRKKKVNSKYGKLPSELYVRHYGKF